MSSNLNLTVLHRQKYLLCVFSKNKKRYISALAVLSALAYVCAITNLCPLNDFSIFSCYNQEGYWLLCTCKLKIIQGSKKRWSLGPCILFSHREHFNPVNVLVSVETTIHQYGGHNAHLEGGAGKVWVDDLHPIEKLDRWLMCGHGQYPRGSAGRNLHPLLLTDTDWSRNVVGRL